MTPTQFRRPKTGDKPLRVRFRGGVERGPYTAAMLRWTDSGHDFDVVAVERVK